MRGLHQSTRLLALAEWLVRRGPAHRTGKASCARASLEGNYREPRRDSRPGVHGLARSGRNRAGGVYVGGCACRGPAYIPNDTALAAAIRTARPAQQ